MLASLFIVSAIAQAADFDAWSEPSPNQKLWATARRVANPDRPNLLYFDGLEIFISDIGPEGRPGRVIAHLDFAGRLISRIGWSPDSKFLLFTTTSSGGHSPWHFNTFVFCVSDKTFRDVEDVTGGSVIAPNFRFESSDTAVLTVHDTTAPEKDGEMASKQIKISLAKLSDRMKPLP